MDIKPKILLVVSPNYSIKILQEEIDNIKKGESDFTKSVDWRISAPLGILYIAAALRKAGYDVKIYDLHRAFYLCRENGYFKKKGLPDFLKDYFENILKEERIDILGISCLFNVASTSVEEMVRICKRISPETKIVLGGHYPTNQYREIFKKGFSGYIILGEAEEEFVWLVDNMNKPFFDKKVSENHHIVDSKSPDNKTKGPAFIENLDSLDMPAWDLLPHCREYIEKSLHSERAGTSVGRKTIKAAGILTTRGCPMMCTFCAAHGVHGRKMRAHSIDYVMKYIDWLVDKYDINHLLIEDDRFDFPPQRTIEFCKTILKKYGHRFTIEFPNGLAVWGLTEEVIEYLKKIGLKVVTIAIESGNAYVQKHILKKNLDLNLVKQKVNLLKKHNVGVRAFYIIGFVGETLEMMRDTIQFALDLNIDWSEIKILTPLAGSEMYDIAKSKGYLIGDTSENVYGRCCIETPDFKAEQVKELQYDANIRINFLNNRNLKEGKFNAAEKVFSNLLNVFPNHLFAQWGLWKALEGQGKKREAQKAFAKLAGMAKKDERNRFLLEKYNIKPE